MIRSEHCSENRDPAGSDNDKRTALVVVLQRFAFFFFVVLLRLFRKRAEPYSPPPLCIRPADVHSTPTGRLLADHASA